MAVGFAATLVNGWLDAAFATANCWIKLHTGDPGAAGATAAAVGDATRKQATMGAAAGGVKSATASVGPWTNGGTTETLSHFSVWSASTAGTFNASGPIGTPQQWQSTNTVSMTALSLSISPVAS